MLSVDPNQDAKVFKEHDWYKFKIESKRAKVPTLKMKPDKAIGGRVLRKNLVFKEYFTDSIWGMTLDKPTDEDTEVYLKSLIWNKDSTYDPTSVKEAKLGPFFFRLTSKILPPELQLTARAFLSVST